MRRSVRSIDADDHARCLEDGASVRAFGEAELLGAAVSDDRRQHVAAADFQIDLTVDRAVDDAGDGAAEDVPGAHFRVVQVGAKDDRACLDDGARRHARLQPESFDGPDGYGRNNRSSAGELDGHFGIDRALDDRRNSTPEDVPCAYIHCF